MKKVAAIAVLLIFVSACGETGLFDGLGERAGSYVEGTTSTTVGETVSSEAPATADVVAVESVSWFNRAIEGEATGDPGAVIATVWARRGDSGRFVQASPAEIVVALPGIQFPSVVPGATRWVTSQLVYDTASATLDIDVSSAFGLWATEPYADDGSQLAVLRVGQDLGDIASGDGVRSFATEDGLSLTWTDGTYRYELFCVADLPADACNQMAGAAGSLEAFAPPAAAPVSG